MAEQGRTAQIEVHFSRGWRRGVFAQRSFRSGETIERAPVLLVPDEDRDLAAQTDLVFYLLEWPVRGRELALPLGLGAMYRHGQPPNARVDKRLEELVMDVVALRQIAEGEEFTVDHRTLGQLLRRRR